MELLVLAMVALAGVVIRLIQVGRALDTYDDGRAAHDEETR